MLKPHTVVGYKVDGCNVITVEPLGSGLQAHLEMVGCELPLGLVCFKDGQGAWRQVAQPVPAHVQPVSKQEADGVPAGLALHPACRPPTHLPLLLLNVWSSPDETPKGLFPKKL